MSEKSSLFVLGVMILVWGCLMVMFKSMGKMLGLGLILLLSFNFLKVNYFLKVNFCFCKVIKRVIGKLKWFLDLGKFEGERLMVIFKGGKVKLLFCKVDWICCLVFWIELLVKFEIINVGKVFVKVVFIVIIFVIFFCMVV